ncbi:DinB family protein [Cohnella nanjingensis]|uniref:DinB family protein n=1 Tax=Cohnella nanjingensis TaxID=1387779 RepID=A0A7X0VIE7_9BACL|nr:DinB family protein [Cohnella nanjingensis]MBB6674876.1 DinB family protein [Cohnella nanjingensis]
MIADTLSELETLLQTVPERFSRLTPEAAARPRAPGKWSRLQILGHLCDSAVNNLTRFVHGAAPSQEPLAIRPYDQNAWVAAQRYDDAPVDEVLALWLALNRSVVRVAKGLPADRLAHRCRLANGTVVTLEWLVTDYLDHLNHHLRQIFDGDETN